MHKTPLAGMCLQPKFLSKKQREELALKRREEEAALQKQKCVFGSSVHPSHPAVAGQKMCPPDRCWTSMVTPLHPSMGLRALAQGHGGSFSQHAH